MKKRYLKDYTRDESGGFRYTGKFYRSAISDADRKKHSLVGAAGGISGILITFAALSLKCFGNMVVYVVLPLEFTLLCYGYYLSGIVVFYQADDRMELRTYEGAFLRTVQSITMAMILQIISLLGESWIILTTRGGSGREEFYLLLGIVLTLIISIFLWKKQRKLIAPVREEKQDA